ncbi:unnamed protein product [Schistosoma curassoni]|uniref:Uncharacterized protein n=1 Tax=Schistosoma curassoni TaxID=6186 RepID=A0A183JX84_9TREM|nr:unnamed protein product [Schistosoma curassoni]
MVVEGRQQETQDLRSVLFGTCQQCVPVILRELMLLEGFDPVSPSFTEEEEDEGGEEKEEEEEEGEEEKEEEEEGEEEEGEEKEEGEEEEERMMMMKWISLRSGYVNKKRRKPVMYT